MKEKNKRQRIVKINGIKTKVILPKSLKKFPKEINTNNKEEDLNDAE